ncbi:MAG TPA: pantoate--beta-alanine ligase [Pseudonocardiaceae bacterium]|nr:pantoate--beta-alanine ligase [Pseudonocardiaceae bacterium]
MTGFVPGELAIHSHPGTLTPVTRALRRSGRPVVLVPTMGALHAGHRELIRAARRTPDAGTVVSIFVNPLQFGPHEDLDRYPRRFDADVALCREEGVELMFAPAVAAMYPPGSDTTVHPGALGAELEGASRPGHFTGVLTVVAKLFGIVGPDRAFFGEKDYQQLVLIQQMAQDLHLDVHVVGVPTVREPDGLALSSRNAYLGPDQRAVAGTLCAALRAGAHAGPHGPAAVLTAARQVLAAQRAVVLDYLALRSPGLGPPPPRGPARLLVAGTIGTTRLIDNIGVHLGVADPTPPGGIPGAGDGVAAHGSSRQGGPRCSAPC